MSKHGFKCGMKQSTSFQTGAKPNDGKDQLVSKYGYKLKYMTKATNKDCATLHKISYY